MSNCPTLKILIITLSATVAFNLFSQWIKSVLLGTRCLFNPFNPDFTLSSSSTTSRELRQQFSTCSGWRWFEVGKKIKENYHVLVSQFHGYFHSKPLGCRIIRSVFGDVIWCFNASWGLKGLNIKICTCLVSNETNISNFHRPEVVGRGSETQLQVGEN